MKRAASLRIGGAIIVCGVLLAACSSSSSTTTSTPPAATETSSTNTPPPTSSQPSGGGGSTSSTVDGKWNGTYSPNGGGSGDFSVTFTQSGSSLDGTLSIAVSCLNGAKVTGKVTGNSIQFGSVQGQCSVDYKGTINGDQMSGTYGLGAGTAGTWKASKA
jgi:hypothetical protein